MEGRASKDWIPRLVFQKLGTTWFKKMSLVDEMKDLVEKMKAGKAERRQRLKEIRKETAEDLSGFTSVRKKMAAGLREDLKASTKTIKEEVSAMRGGFRARQKELKGEIQTMSKVWRGVPETSKKLRKEVYPRER